MEQSLPYIPTMAGTEEYTRMNNAVNQELMKIADSLITMEPSIIKKKVVETLEDYTNKKMYKEGFSRNIVDECSSLEDKIELLCKALSTIDQRAQAEAYILFFINQSKKIDRKDIKWEVHMSDKTSTYTMDDQNNWIGLNTGYDTKLLGVATTAYHFFSKKEAIKELMVSRSK